MCAENKACGSSTFSELFKIPGPRLQVKNNVLASRNPKPWSCERLLQGYTLNSNRKTPTARHEFAGSRC